MGIFFHREFSGEVERESELEVIGRKRVGPRSGRRRQREREREEGAGAGLRVKNKH